MRNRKRVGEILSFGNCFVIGKTLRRYSHDLVLDEVVLSVEFLREKLELEVRALCEINLTRREGGIYSNHYETNINV